MKQKSKNFAYQNGILKRISKCFPVITTFSIFIVFTYFIYIHSDNFINILDFPLEYIIILISLNLVFPCFNGVLNYLLYRKLDVPLSLNESVGLAVVNTLANHLPFAGGIVAKGVYLKRKHQLAYSSFFSATLALYVCFVASSGVLGIGVLSYWLFIKNIDVPIELFAGFLLMGGSIVFLWIPLAGKWLPNKTRKRLEQLVQGWHILGRNPALLAKLIAIQMGMTVIIAGRFWIVFHLFSLPVTMIECVLFSATTILTRLISITPGGLGVRELIVIGVGSFLGFEVGISAAALGLDRLLASFIVFVLGSVYSYTLSKQLVSAPQP